MRGTRLAHAHCKHRKSRARDRAFIDAYNFYNGFGDGQLSLLNAGHYGNVLSSNRGTKEMVPRYFVDGVYDEKAKGHRNPKTGELVKGSSAVSWRYNVYGAGSGTYRSESYRAQSDGWGNTDAWGNGLNAFGFANGAKTEIIDYAVRSGSSQAGLRAELQTLGKAGTRYLNAAKGLSKGAGILGVAFTAVDAYQKGQWQNHHKADVLIGLGTTFMLSGPWGWAAGGAYFLIDMGVKSYSGKSITENLFDGP